MISLMIIVITIIIIIMVMMTMMMMSIIILKMMTTTTTMIMMMMMMTIMMMMMTLTERQRLIFFKSTPCTANCLQHASSHGNSNNTPVNHVQQVSLAWCKGAAELLSLTRVKSDGIPQGTPHSSPPSSVDDFSPQIN